MAMGGNHNGPGKLKNPPSFAIKENREKKNLQPNGLQIICYPFLGGSKNVNVAGCKRLLQVP